MSIVQRFADFVAAQTGENRAALEDMMLAIMQQKSEDWPLSKDQCDEIDRRLEQGNSFMPTSEIEALFGRSFAD